MVKVKGHAILVANDVKGVEGPTVALPLLEVEDPVSKDVNVNQGQSEDSKEKVGQNNAIQEASAPLESNNVLSDYISKVLINENMFNITEIKNALLNALKIEFGKLLTMELSKEQADYLGLDVAGPYKANHYRY